jgi:hypothetical protein
MPGDQWNQLIHQGVSDAFLPVKLLEVFVILNWIVASEQNVLPLLDLLLEMHLRRQAGFHDSKRQRTDLRRPSGLLLVQPDGIKPDTQIDDEYSE